MRAAVQIRYRHRHTKVGSGAGGGRALGGADHGLGPSGSSAGATAAWEAGAPRGGPAFVGVAGGDRGRNSLHPAFPERPLRKNRFKLKAASNPSLYLDVYLKHDTANESGGPTSRAHLVDVLSHFLIAALALDPTARGCVHGGGVAWRSGFQGKHVGCPPQAPPPSPPGQRRRPAPTPRALRCHPLPPPPPKHTRRLTP